MAKNLWMLLQLVFGAETGFGSLRKYDNELYGIDDQHSPLHSNSDMMFGIFVFCCRRNTIRLALDQNDAKE